MPAIVNWFLRRARGTFAPFETGAAIRGTPAPPLFGSRATSAGVYDWHILVCDSVTISDAREEVRERVIDELRPIDGAI